MADETGSRERAQAVESVEKGPLRRWLPVYLKGAAMGAADTVPGVSGGTIALITGIYERLVAAIAGLGPDLLGDLRGLHRRAGRRQFLAALRERDVPFLVVLGVGAVTAVVGLSRVMHAAIVDFPAPTFAFFFGLIAASAVVLYRQLAVDTPGAVVAGAAGFLVAFWLSGVSGGGAIPHTLPVVFLTAAVAITAMILPGVSGSFLLILLGQYEYLTGVLKRAVDDTVALVTGGGGEGLLEGLTVVAVFAVGAALGLLSVSRVIRWALAHYRRATLSFLVALMVGSLRLPVVRVIDGVAAWNPAQGGIVVGAAVVGAGAVLALDQYTDDLEL